MLNLFLQLLLPNTAALAVAKPGPALRALKKVSGALTISAECASAAGVDLPLLSSALRKCDVATLWTSDLACVESFVDEQESARGDFPGPCPVVFDGPAAQAAAAAAAGAAAVVLDAEQREHASALGAVDVLWRVSSAAEAQSIADAGLAAAAFVVPGDAAAAAAAAETLAALPEGAFAVVSLEAMSDGDAEIDAGRQLAAAGAAAVVLRSACVGDDEDVPYCQHAVKELMSKQSREFRIGGLTGAANGHFGTGVSSKRGAREWRRRAAVAHAA